MLTLCPSLHRTPTRPRLLPSLGPEGIPPDRLLALHGEGGDLADAASYAPSPAAKPLRKRLGWLPRGVLRFVRTGAHTPGSIALIHQPRCGSGPGSRGAGLAGGWQRDRLR